MARPKGQNTLNLQNRMDSGPRPNPQGGFYQAEILVGISILLIVIAIVAGYYKYNLQASKRSNAYYVSTQLAAAALERAKGDISNPDTLAALLAKVADTTHTRKSTVKQQGKVFAVEVKFRKVSPTANLMRIKASVKWDVASGNAMGTVYPYEP